MKYKQDYNELVRNVVANARSYFDGLCLNCIDTSKPKTVNTDVDYWEHKHLTEADYAYGCWAGKHAQPTLFIFFHGKKGGTRSFPQGEICYAPVSKHFISCPNILTSENMCIDEIEVDVIG